MRIKKKYDWIFKNFWIIFFIFLETENVFNQLKISRNIFKMLSCIENANINNQWKFIYLRSSVLELLVEILRTNFRFPLIFFLCFTRGAFENYCGF